MALLDYRMPGMDGAEVAAAVQRDELPTRVLLVSAHDESAIVYRALQEGAAGFLPKESTRSELVNAVLKCAKGRDVIAPELAAGLAGEIRRRNEPDGPVLSPREREVLKLIAAGSSIPAMAKELYLAPSTVRPTCNGSTRNSASATAAPRSPRRCAASCWNSVDNALSPVHRLLRGGPVRVSAFLRLPLIGLIAVLVWIWEVDHWLPELYAVILGVYAVAAVLWLVAVLRGPVPRWADWASTGVDLLVIITLCLVSGGATAALLPVFFLLPISVAFQDRPVLTAIIGTVTAVGYLAVWIFYSKRDDKVGLPNMVYTHFGFLLWLAVATTALCFVLARRSVRVRGVAGGAAPAGFRGDAVRRAHNREVAEHLHDGPLQTLLAARLELDEPGNEIPTPRSTWSTRRCRKPRPDCAPPSRELHPAGAGPTRPHPGGARTVAAIRVSHRSGRRGRARRRG